MSTSITISTSLRTDQKTAFWRADIGIIRWAGDKPQESAFT
jgi:hypothetical protein